MESRRNDPPSFCLYFRWFPSGLAALLVATVSLWMVLLDWLRPGGTRPSLRVFAGIVLRLAGLVLLESIRGFIPFRVLAMKP
jgi:drug/metabolite transporter (DMT)-like permease